MDRTKFKSYIEDRINNKPFDYHKDDTRVGGMVIRNKSGDEYFFNGKTGNSEVLFENDTVALITIPYSGHYRRKHFIGILFEYRTEEKNINGKYQVKLMLDFFSSNLDDKGITETGGDVQDAGHSAHQSAASGLREDIISALIRR